MRERPVWAQISDSEQEDGAVAFMNKYLASATTAYPTCRSATYPTHQEWEDQLELEETILCADCGYRYELCECRL